jgi:hypothetical protein
MLQKVCVLQKLRGGRENTERGVLKATFGELECSVCSCANASFGRVYRNQYYPFVLKIDSLLLLQKLKERKLNLRFLCKMSLPDCTVQTPQRYHMHIVSSKMKALAYTSFGHT